MKLSFLNKAVNRSIQKIAFKLEKHAPEILVAIGVGGGITATVLACKATLSAQDILADSKDKVDEINSLDSKDEVGQNELKKVYIHTGLELARVYGPSIAIGTASIVSIFASHKMMRNRVATLVTAYGTLDSAFKEYRKRVADNFGADKELETYHDVKFIEETTGEGETVSLAKRNEDIEKVDGYSIYARCFDEYNPNWKDNADYNLDFLRGVQRYLNDQLEYRGFLFLNEVYRELGFDETPAGQLVGWIYDPNRTDVGDNCVSFGLYNPEHGAALGDFINGYNKSVFLDFNVDGVIVDRI